MRRFGALALVAGVACGEMYPAREFDCAAIAAAYTTMCSGHLGISSETNVCAAVRDGQSGAFAATIDMAAAVCEAAEDCAAMFVCLDDAQGLSALARGVQVNGVASVGGTSFALDASTGWAWIGTTAGGNAGDFEALFEVDGLPWYFRIDDFVVRAETEPFVVDAARPIKLENAVDNVELAAGSVMVSGFALDGVFNLEVTAMDPATGESLELSFVGSFAE